MFWTQQPVVVNSILGGFYILLTYKYIYNQWSPKTSNEIKMSNEEDETNQMLVEESKLCLLTVMGEGEDNCGNK